MSETWQGEQREVWGNGPEWADALDRLQRMDATLQFDVASYVGKGDAESVLTTALETIAPPPAVVLRVEEQRAAILEGIRSRIAYGTPPHVIAQYACNAVLRGVTEYGPAVTVFPEPA